MVFIDMGFSDHTQGKRNPKGKVSRRKNNCFNLIHRRDSGEPRRWATWTTRVIHINHLGGLFIKLSKQEQIRQIGETESAPIQSVKHSSEIKNPREENSFRGFYWVGLPVLQISLLIASFWCLLICSVISSLLIISSDKYQKTA